MSFCDVTNAKQVAKPEPADGNPVHGAAMTAWIRRQRLWPQSVLYPQVMTYPTSRPTFVASLDDLLSKGN
jgi:hypothetical protein